jgi:XTP/dITP diphosphohydrolase/tetrapyrrole methylase family protein/MazG family protein
MARLRGPGGCPWDHEQTHESLCETLIEETAELLETIDKADYPHMREELGDVLLQVVFHAQIAAERGDFDFDDVAREINEKLVRRHPHVFGDLDLQDSAAVLVNWEKIKAEEKAKSGRPPATTRLKELPPRLPALLFARGVYKELVKHECLGEAGFQRASVQEKAATLDDAGLGAELFALVAAAREAGLDPESALRRETQRIIDRIEHGGTG